MTKTTPKQKSSAKPTSLFIRLRKYSLVLLVVLLAGYFLVYTPLIIRQDKQRFKQAEASLEALYSDIEAKVGKPSQIRRESSCRYASRKFEKGPLGCGVEINLLYENADKDRSNRLMLSISQLINSPLRDRQTLNPKSEFVDKNTYRDTQAFSQTYMSFDEVACSTSYFYPPNFGLLGPFQSTSSEESLEVTLSCGGPAKEKYYPVKG